MHIERNHMHNESRNTWLRRKGMLALPAAAALLALAPAAHAFTSPDPSPELPLGVYADVRTHNRDTHQRGAA